jgi:hypothetical protein
METIPAYLDLPKTHVQALRWLFDNVPPDKLPWVLSGSGCLRLHGVDIPVHDLDIITDEQTIYHIEQRFGNKMRVYVHDWETEGMRSLDGKADIEGIQIELLANIAHMREDGTWGSDIDLSRAILIETQGLQVPAFPLEDELAAYTAMGRMEKVALIRKTIARRSIR